MAEELLFVKTLLEYLLVLVYIHLIQFLKHKLFKMLNFLVSNYRSFVIESNIPQKKGLDSVFHLKEMNIMKQSVILSNKLSKYIFRNNSFETKMSM